jgi:hypothetical protein
MQSQSQNNFLALVITTCEILSNYFHSMHQQHLFQTTYLLECFEGYKCFNYNSNFWLNFLKLMLMHILNHQQYEIVF